MKANAQATVKKPYKKPVPKVYGNIQTMTNAAPPGPGQLDGQIVFGTPLKTH